MGGAWEPARDPPRTFVLEGLTQALPDLRANRVQSPSLMVEGDQAGLVPTDFNLTPSATKRRARPGHRKRVPPDFSLTTQLPLLKASLSLAGGLREPRSEHRCRYAIVAARRRKSVVDPSVTAPSVPTTVRHLPPGSLDPEDAEGSPRSCPCSTQKTMPRLVPPRTAAVGVPDMGTGLEVKVLRGASW